MYIGESDEPVRLVGLFKASAFGRIRQAHAEEVRKRCTSCGFVNIFHPATILQPQGEYRNIEVK